MKPLTIFMLGFSLAVGAAPAPVHAEDAKPEVRSLKQETVKDIEEAPELVAQRLSENKEYKANQERREEFFSKYFGVGVFANIDLGANQRVESARVVNGIVRIEESNRVQLGVLLEAHKFINMNASGTKADGPFVGLVAGSEGVISSGALGWMWAWRPVSDTYSMNLGIALMVSPDTQVLGDGIVEDQPLPAGETDVRYKKITTYGVTVAVSFGF
jgi:hypothetical protein